MNKLNIYLQPGQNIFFTSDTHFEHKNVIRFCERPFENINDMEKGLVERWNGVVKENDIIFHLGDVSWFNGRHKMAALMRKLNGRNIYIVPGNHDTVDSFELCDQSIVKVTDSIVHLYLRAEDWEERRWPQKTFEIVLCHYPLMTWSHRSNGALHLFGHIHSGKFRKPDQPDQDLPLWPNMVDVGVDNNDYTPIQFENILTKIKKGTD